MSATVRTAPSAVSHPAAASRSAAAAPEPHALRLAVIVGSVREGRFGPVVAEWFAREAERIGGFATVDVVDLADHRLPLVFPGSAGETDAETARISAALSQRLHAADAFVVVTPEYNHSFPASLKNALDWFHTEWQAKPVGFVSYGGVSGGLRAVEQLRQIFAELHAVTVRDGLSFHSAWERFDADGLPRDTEGTSAAAAAMLRQLRWWADALHAARARAPYGRQG
ncbi:NADPH-dependent FMN reductase [Streptomyces hazeniae]|uniref:NADPH-dependent FMN reductase n=1 Tax=Streptomyces hazeniae TaxID=3075538 RepID=UPI00374DFC55